MKVIVNGANGKMGKVLLSLIEKENTVAAKFDKFGEDCISPADFKGEADVIIDFSNHLAIKEICAFATEKNIPLVVATTGHTADEIETINETAKKIPLFFSANMSVGIALLCNLAKQTAKIFPDADIEIIEKHHNRKLDAPSGTALMLAEAIREEKKQAFFTYGREGQKKREKDEIGIHAIRMGDIVGEHEVIVCTDTQTITLKHQAHSRALFAEGALVAAEYLVGKPAGFYNMQTMLGD